MTAAHPGPHGTGSPGGHQAAGATPAGAPRPPEPELDVLDAVHRLEAEEHDEVRPPAAGTVSNLVTAAAVIVLGVAVLVGSSSLGIGSASTPDSGTWPLLVSVVLVLLGLGLVAVARRTADAEKFTRTSWLVVAGLVTMVVFVLVLPVIGFEIPAALLCFVWLRFLGGEGWRSSIVTSLGVVVAFYLVFVAALSVPIPHLF